MLANSKTISVPLCAMLWVNNTNMKPNSHTIKCDKWMYKQTKTADASFATSTPICEKVSSSWFKKNRKPKSIVPIKLILWVLM